MDFDLFLTSPRWEILQIIAKKPSSPVQISKQLKTTVAYISQQLKLLDAAGFVLKKKTGAVEKGKPRTLFSLSEELMYVAGLTENFTKKKLIRVTDHHKAILRIWLLYDTSLHYPLEKLFWKLEENMQDIQAIFIEEKADPKVIIVSENKKLKQKIDVFVQNLDKKINYLFVSENQLKKSPPTSLAVLYDPDNLLNNLKGGK